MKYFLSIDDNDNVAGVKLFPIASSNMHSYHYCPSKRRLYKRVQDEKGIITIFKSLTINEFLEQATQGYNSYTEEYLVLQKMFRHKILKFFQDKIMFSKNNYRLIVRAVMDFGRI